MCTLEIVLYKRQIEVAQHSFASDRHSVLFLYDRYDIMIYEEMLSIFIIKFPIWQISRKY